MNLSKSGASLSYRAKAGSIGARGFSVRSGIPGLSFRQNWKAGSSAGAFVGLILAIFSLASLAVSLLIPVISFFIWLFILLPINALAWVAGTLFDFAAYLINRRKAGTAKDA